MGQKNIGPIKSLGTLWRIEIFDTNNDIEKNILEKKIESFLNEFDDNYSRFKPESYLGRLNSSKTIANPPADLVAMISCGIEMFRKTEGVFNITVAGELEKRGYGAGSGSDISDPSTTISFGENSINILKNSKIDLGGLGKGYAIDQLAQFLQSQGIKYFVINGGGDIYATSDGEGNPIKITLAHPQKPATALGNVIIKNQALAASSPFLRTWTDSGGENQHHLVGDAEPRAVFVIAESALVADSWATALSLGVGNHLLPNSLAAAIIENEKILADNRFRKHWTMLD